jgi:hypothetical protein
VVDRGIIEVVVGIVVFVVDARLIGAVVVVVVVVVVVTEYPSCISSRIQMVFLPIQIWICIIISACV